MKIRKQEKIKVIGSDPSLTIGFLRRIVARQKSDYIRDAEAMRHDRVVRISATETIYSPR